MKKINCLVVLIFLILFNLSAQTFDYENPEVTRLYIFGMISFYVKYEIYCSTEAVGYFKYPALVNDEEYFFTYEGKQFYEQSLFDENFISIACRFLPIFGQTVAESLCYSARHSLR